MTAVAIPVFQMPDRYPTLPPTALSFNIGSGTAMTSPGDGVTFPSFGREVIIVKGGAGSHVLTIKSVPDPILNRSGDIVYTLGIGLMAVLPQLDVEGFRQADGTVVITGDAGCTDVLFWVLELTN